jgi:hypothetical protein
MNRMVQCKCEISCIDEYGKNQLVFFAGAASCTACSSQASSSCGAGQYLYACGGGYAGYCESCPGGTVSTSGEYPFWLLSSVHIPLARDFNEPRAQWKAYHRIYFKYDWAEHLKGKLVAPSEGLERKPQRPKTGTQAFES